MSSISTIFLQDNFRGQNVSSGFLIYAASTIFYIYEDLLKARKILNEDSTLFFVLTSRNWKIIGPRSQPLQITNVQLMMCSTSSNLIGGIFSSVLSWATTENLVVNLTMDLEIVCWVCYNATSRSIDFYEHLEHQFSTTRYFAW